MSELRQDPVRGEWVYYAANRRNKPYDFKWRQVSSRRAGGDCAFCPGHEGETPAAVYQDGPNGAWTVRVFENRYPAVAEAEPDFVPDGFYRNVPGLGRHEVLVDTADHGGVLHEFPLEHIQKILWVLQERMREIQKDPRVMYVQIFKNCGPEAGASIAHSHWQLLGAPVPGKEQQDALDHARAYRAAHDSCLFCDIVAKELAEGGRVVAQNQSFLAFTPYASRSAFELWIISKTHIASFVDFSEAQRESFGALFYDILRRLPRLRDGLGYNICFQDVPRGAGLGRVFHWYCRIVPRIGAPAGFEFGTGNRINPVTPEAAAEIYRQLGEEL